MAATNSYQDIEKKLSIFNKPFEKSEIPYILLSAFGKSETYIKRYKEGKGIVSHFNGLLIKKLIAYKETSTKDLLNELNDLKESPIVKRAIPRLLIVSDGISIQAYDPKENESYDNKLSSLWLDFQFFYPLEGVERYRGIEENPADIKAAEKMAKLHDEIRRYNEFSSTSDLHDLNIFMTRLLFCFFAEDTGIFQEDLFIGSINRYTQEDGSDLSNYLDACFNVMDDRIRKNVPKIISQFPYVNGGLFHKHIHIPKMGSRARKLILECGKLDWKDINPDIFGSMIQAVVSPEQRGTLGMHYTSVPNIMKVIGPLFLNNLYENFKDSKNNEKKLHLLLLRISKMKFFDPACGSGNFLIISYKELRKLEIEIWKRIADLNHGQIQIPFINVQLHQFYGIEIDDFAHEVATLSLWLAEHQMNCIFTEAFSNVHIPALPLHNNENIKLANACQIDWNKVCPRVKGEEVFVMGNPPYLGSKLQSVMQKEEIIKIFFDIKNCKVLDYISIWFYLGAKYISKTEAKYAFVSTNSICQGEQVSILWPNILKEGVDIFFAHTSFKWSNNAKHNAGVTCVVIGVSKSNNDTKKLFQGSKIIETNYINPYLSIGTQSIVYKKVGIPKGLPKMCFGCMPYDNGNLLFNSEERRIFIEKYPPFSHFLKRLYGAEEFINDKYRYCLWINNNELCEALKNPEIQTRIERTKQFRLASPAGKELANRPYQFREYIKLGTKKIIVPSVSSEKREYIPIGFLEGDDVISNSAFAIYDASLWLFGILTSRMHMLWVKTVGGRLKTDYRYSAQLCYNTFPFPKLNDNKKAQIQEATEEILLCRADYPDRTLADLYDPNKMPQNLREAHCALDLVVDSCYQTKLYVNDEERLENLFYLYEKMTKKP